MSVVWGRRWRLYLATVRRLCPRAPRAMEVCGRMSGWKWRLAVVCGARGTAATATPTAGFHDHGPPVSWGGPRPHASSAEHASTPAAVYAAAPTRVPRDTRGLRRGLIGTFHLHPGTKLNFPRATPPPFPPKQCWMPKRLSWLPGKNFRPCHLHPLPALFRGEGGRAGLENTKLVLSRDGGARLRQTC